MTEAPAAAAATATFTITFGDCAENHVGMEKLGVKAEQGFDKACIMRAKSAFEAKGRTCELHALHDALPDEKQRVDPAHEAYLLVVREGLAALADTKLLLAEMSGLAWDKKAKMKGKVVDKHARWNLCFADRASSPDYDQGRGRVVAFSSLPVLNRVRGGIAEMLGDQGKGLLAEGNHYYDVSKCYIGWHGDAERRKVVAVRLGASMPLAYQWFQQGVQVGGKRTVTLHHGDLYIMSAKAVGTDWKLRKTLTLRHAAGTQGIKVSP